MYSPDASAFTGPASISLATFAAVLAERRSPVLTERDAGEYYAAIIAEGADPAGILAMFAVESACATNPDAVCVAFGTHSWGNTRTEARYATLDSDGQPVTVDTRHGRFTVYPDWLAGCRSTAYHLSTGPYRGLTIGQAIAKWAPNSENDTGGYISRLIGYMNWYGARDGQRKGHPMRVILSAGHQNIGNLTDERLGAGWGDRLRGQTGALGTEATPNEQVVQTAADLLRKAGVDVATADATYQADAYAQPADLCVFVHHDGVPFGSDRPQHAGGVAVHSGGDAPGRFTRAAYDNAARFAALWHDANARITGIANENTDTADMEQIYSGYYPTTDTPTVCIECSIWGGSDGQRPDVDTGKEGHALAAAVADYGGLGDAADSTGTSGDSAGGAGGQQSGGGTQGGDAGSGFVAAAGGAYRVETPAGDQRRISVRLPFTGTGPAPEYSVAYGFLDRWLGPEYDPTGTSDPGNLVESAVGRDGWPLTNEWTYAPPGIQPVTAQVFERAVYMVDADGNVTAMDTGRQFLHGLGAGLRPTDAWIS